MPSRTAILVLLVGASALFLPSPSRAGVINVPADEPTIQDAMNAAALFGDEIVLADGTYTGASNRDIVVDKHVTIRSASGDPELCIIDCQDLGRAFLFDGVVSAARLENVTVINGLAGLGGGIAFDNSSAVVTGCRILGNVANTTGGGGVGVSGGGSPSLINCVISGNSRFGIAVLGGGAYVTGGSTPTFTNCTLSGNSGWDASAVYSTGSGTVTTLVNCVVWGHDFGQTGVDIQSTGGAVTNITYSDVEDGYAGTGNIDANPGFIDADGADNLAGTLDDDLRLGSFSPCTDAGDNGAAGLSGVTVDIGGESRFADDTNVADTGSGSAPLVDMGAHERQTDSVSQEIAVPGDAATIQAGIDLAQLGDHVVVADGVYTGPGNRDLQITKNIVVRSAGGDPGNCVIDCEQASRGVTFTGTGSQARLEGITVQNGLAGLGGGILISGSDAVIYGCRIQFNTANVTGGGGIGVDDDSAPSIINCTLIGNTRSGIGVNGGGAYVRGSSDPWFINCSFSDNSGYDGSALFGYGSGTVTSLVNCVVWGNDPGISGDPIVDFFNSTTLVTYSNVEGGFAGAGNIDTNPIFADTDLRLAPISPCVDAGDNSAVTFPTDYDGNDRIFDGDGDMTATVDMGAFEYGSSSQLGIPGETAVSRIALRAWPNPTRAAAHIRFELSRPGPVSAEIFDVTGSRVRTLVDDSMNPGVHEILWDGRDRRGTITGAGVYFLRLRTPDGEAASRILRIQ